VGAVHVQYFTDPACPWSWAAEPAVRRLQVEFGEGVSITYVMGGLAREFREPLETMRHVLDAAAASAMPTDPRLWLDAPPKSSYPSCQAVKAAAEQGRDGDYLRVVREGLMVDRLTLDNPDALIAAARRVPGLDIERFAIDVQSSAIVEGFGADLERTRAAARDGERRVPFPSFAVRGDDHVHWLYDTTDPTELRAAVLMPARRRGRCPASPRRCGASGASPRPRSPPSATVRGRWRPPSCGGWPPSGSCARSGR
jgi:predicted DsbA family dithiol-disulfide isomerase